MKQSSTQELEDWYKRTHRVRIPSALIVFAICISIGFAAFVMVDYLTAPAIGPASERRTYFTLPQHPDKRCYISDSITNPHGQLTKQITCEPLLSKVP